MRMSSGTRSEPRRRVRTRRARSRSAGASVDAIEYRQLLAREHQSDRSARVLHRNAPRLDRLVRVGGTDHHHVRHRAQARELLDRLVRRAVLAERDAVVRPHVDHVRVAQRGQPNARPHVVGERQERRAERNHAAVMRHSREDRRHRVLADAEVDVPPAHIPTRRPPFPAWAASVLLSGTSALWKSPLSFIIVRVDGSRSAEPPTRFGTDSASAPIALRTGVARGHLAVRRA